METPFVFGKIASEKILLTEKLKQKDLFQISPPL